MEEAQLPSQWHRGGQLASTHRVAGLALAFDQLRELVPVHSARQRAVDRQQCPVHQLQVVLYQARLHGADEAAEKLPAISIDRDVGSRVWAYHIWRVWGTGLDPRLYL